MKGSEAMKGFQDKMGKTQPVVEEVFGTGDLVTTRGKDTMLDKEGNVFFQTK